MPIHIGAMIKEELERQGRSKVWLAKTINRSESTCYNIFNSDTINTDLLMSISKALNYNFFKEFSDEFDRPSSKIL